MLRRIVIFPQALEDLNAIHATIASDNPPIADHFLLAVDSTLEMIARFPLLGATSSYPPLRLKSVPGFPRYRIVYYPTPKQIRVTAVLHSARDQRTALADRPPWAA